MDPPVSTFWAKLRPYGGSQVEAWHTLEAHAADVAACTEALLQRSLLRRRLARLGDQNHLTEIQVERLSALAALHDLGKFNVGFQNKKLKNPPFTAGHVGEALTAFGHQAGMKIGQALQLETMQDWGVSEYTFEDLLVTALGHHGRPVAPGGQPTPGAWEPTEELNPFEGIADLRRSIEAWYPAAFRGNGPPLPEHPGFQHAFNGLLTLADWIASNESFFPFAQRDGPPRIDFARDRAEEALQYMGLDPAPSRDGLIDRPPSFDQVWEFPPRPAQQLFEDLAVPEGPSLSILEAPTGSGKTEAALIRFLKLFSTGAVDGLYFALPTRAAATQIYGRVRSAVERVIPDPRKRPPVVHAVPGYLDDEAKPALLEDRAALWSDDDRHWRYRSWASERPKRYLAGTVAVGTIDQVLLSALKVDHSHLRATSLLRHLLVIDEVHASDVYMSRVTEEVLKRQLAAGGHAMLMSATLGERARHRYTRLVAGTRDEQEPLEEARGKPYPVVHQLEAQVESTCHPLTPIDLSRKEVQVEILDAMDTPDRIARHALAAADVGARVLVIRNTVSGCRNTQKALERRAGRGEEDRLFRCEGLVAPHHSRFARPDRVLLDQAVERFFGRETTESSLVLVATQTVEQSLDIDADLLITDLCPADVLLQRIGRLHRHRRDGRPSGFDQPRVVVLVPPHPDLGHHIAERGQHAGRAWGPHGIGTVYEDLRILEATWQELRERSTLTLPDDSRELVEAATHPTALAEITEDHDGAWSRHAQTMNGIRRAEAGIADLNLADWSARFGSRDSLFPDDPGERIKTRLGEGNRRAVLPEPVVGPFGEAIEELTVPAWMAGEPPGREQVELLEAGREVIAFQFGSHHFRYDRLGLLQLEPNGDGGASE